MSGHTPRTRLYTLPRDERYGINFSLKSTSYLPPNRLYTLPALAHLTGRPTRVVLRSVSPHPPTVRRVCSPAAVPSLTFARRGAAGEHDRVANDADRKTRIV